MNPRVWSVHSSPGAAKSRSPWCALRLSPNAQLGNAHRFGDLGRAHLAVL